MQPCFLVETALLSFLPIKKKRNPALENSAATHRRLHIAFPRRGITSHGLTSPTIFPPALAHAVLCSGTSSALQSSTFRARRNFRNHSLVSRTLIFFLWQ